MSRVTASAARVGRSPEDVTLVAVTKGVDVSRMKQAYDLGIREFGESRIQEVLPKRSELSNPSLRWHFIGHLQTNKVKRVVGDFLLIHSVDSFRLAEALNREAVALGQVQPILLQVNVSGETSKHGIAPDETPVFVERVTRELPGLQVKGFMTMAPYHPEMEAARPHFRRLRELRDDIAKSAPEGVTLDHLSMGMSQDYPVAIEEGATLIRIGSALFGPRDPNAHPE